MPALLGIAAEPVLDRRPPLSELLGDDARRLQERLYETADRGATVRAWLTERALRRRVTAAVGYGPKRLARVLRLRRALALVGDGSSLGDAAYEAGYADQAHFGHDCLELAGVAPGRFLQDAAG